MTRLRWILLAGLTILSLALAFFLQDLVYQNVVLPLAYVWWTIVNTYHLIPQLFLWILLLAAVFMLIIGNFVMETPQVRRGRNKPPPVRGQVEALAVWLTSADHGNYFKWLVAHRLSGIMRQLDEGPGRRARLKSGMNRWPGADKSSSSDALEDYLDAGLNRSFGDFPNPRHWFERRKSTPLDLDPAEAVDYLEAQMEESLDRRS